MVKIASIRRNKCKRCKKRKATSLIRGKEVCSDCFEVLNKDNYKRMRLGKRIPRELIVLNLN